MFWLWNKIIVFWKGYDSGKPPFLGKKKILRDFRTKMTTITSDTSPIFLITWLSSILKVKYQVLISRFYVKDIFNETHDLLRIVRCIQFRFNRKLNGFTFTILKLCLVIYKFNTKLMIISPRCSISVAWCSYTVVSAHTGSNSVH